MKDIKSTVFVFMAMLAAYSRAGDSAPFRLDTRAGIRAARATEPLAYSTDWNSGATGVAIDLDGAPLFSAASPASGDYVWNTDGLPDGLHTLTFDDGVETLDAQFYVNPGRIVFNANGGEETMPDFTLIPGAEQTLPESTFTKDGHFLLGWALTPDGEATLLDGDSTADIVAEAGETVTLYAVWHEGVGGKYLVLDLNAGSAAESYSVSCLVAAPDGGFNTDEYKTTKLVLRRIEPGSFIMGGGSDESHGVTLTMPFYCGVFEVTQKQYELVTGSNPSYYRGDKRPIEQVSWNTIRGDSGTYNWPSSANVNPNSFMGRLRARTGLDFDLPTEAQWEYVCRAGTTTDYNNGTNNGGDFSNDPNLNLLGRYRYNRSDGKGGHTDAHTVVGSYQPNAWDLYDMHGNVWEWCLDWYGMLEYGADPKSPSSGSGRVHCGGGWGNPAYYCTSSYVHDSDPSISYNDVGFRLVLPSDVFNTYAVRFDANGGEGAMAKRVYAYGDDVTLPAMGFARDGWTFVGWATEADGPVVYADEGEIKGGIDAANGETITLYARWAQSQYTVHFDANGGVGTIADESFWIGLPGWLSSNAFTRTGYDFAGWATAADGEIELADKALVTNLTEMADATVNLYADWSPHQYEVRFNRGAGTGSMPNQQLTYDTAADLTSNAFARTGYTFAGWATEEGGAKVYDDGAEVLNLATNAGEVIDLYTTWTPNAYSVVFSANGGAGTMANMQFIYDEGQALTANAFTRENRFFSGWATAADGAVVYADGATVSNLTAEPDGAVTLYAVWADCRVVFDANGGERTMDPFYLFAGTEQMLPRGTFTKDGHFLLGWALTSDGEATLLDGDSTVDIVAAPGETVTLYAVWHEGNAATGGECTTGGNANWFVQTSDTHDGIAAARSGVIGHSQSTWLETTVTGSGTISFWWKVSSESVSYDWLAFSIDGSEQKKIGGTGNDWAQVSFNVSGEGDHVLRWTYRKDSSVSSGSDCGWVGEVTWPNSDKPHKWVVGSAPPQLDGFDAAYAVRFDANGGEGTMAKHVYAAADDVTLPTQAFVRDGWIFVGWATEPDGPVVYGETIEGGIDAANGATVTLYARWAQSQYAVHFNANGGEGTMADESFWIGIPGGLSSNAFARTGYDFAGWATTEGGEIAFADRALATNLTETANATANLYAAWEPHQYAVRFNRGAGTGSMPNQTLTYDAETNLAPNTFTRTGYTFAGWAAESNGEKVYDDGADVLNLATNAGAVVDLYTTWTPNEYTVKFDANGGTGTMADLAFTYDQAATLTESAFTYANHLFVGWATVADGAVVYTDGAEISNLTAEANGEVTLYAVWADSRVVFDANGGEGTMEPFYLFAGTEQTLPESTFTKDGHFLLGWALTPDGEATLLDGDSTADIVAEAGETVTLYAVWREGEGGGNGLSVKYYDISSSGYSTWSASETALTNYFAAYTPTIVANTLAFGETLDPGIAGVDQSSINQFRNWGLNDLRFEADGPTNRFHGKYANKNQENIAALLTGTINTETGGTYSFACIADDYEAIFIDGVRVCRSSWNSVGSGSIELSIGPHSFAMGFHEGDGGHGFAVEWKKPGDTVWSPLPQTCLSGGGLLTYAVRFDANGGEGAMAKRVYAYGDDVTLPAMGFARDGWTFAGWAKTPDGPIAYADGETVEGGINAANSETVTLYARWAQSQYAVHFDANGGEGTMADESFWIGVPGWLSSNAFTRMGYAFAGWATAVDGEVEFGDKALVTNLTETANTTANLFAVWMPNEYEVSFDPTEGAFAEAAPTVAAVFDSPYGELPVPSRTGYTFAVWMLSGSPVTAETICITPSNHTLVGAWTPNEYTVTFDANGGALGAGEASKAVTFDAAYGALPVPMFEWHSLKNWLLDGAVVSGETIVSTATDHTLVADWNLAIGGGEWDYPAGNGPITLGAPLVAPSGAVEIPPEIDGRPVVAITEEAFAGNAAITSISIPASVTGLVEGAFAGCTGLREVVIPASVTNIADGAFAGCTGIRRLSVGSLYGHEALDGLLSEIMPDADCAEVECVSFLDGVTNIPDNFFVGCTALRTMDIAESVVEIGTNVFEACSALETTVVDGLEMYQGWVLGYAGGSLGELAPPDLAIPAEYEDETARSEGSPHYGTPYSVRGIAAGAFEGEFGIGTVSLPESLRFVGARAFKDCTSLESISVPEGVAKIDREAFRNCTYAQGLALPGTLREIGDGAFANASMLMGATIPDGVVSVGACAFSNCWRMLSVAIPQSVERVGDGAFADCRRVAGVTVPLHVRPMSELFPAAYASLATIAVAATDGSLGELAPPEAEAWLASRQMVPEVFKGCAALEGIELPAWVRNVSDGALEGCSAIASLELPDAVTNIGSRACAGMAALESVALPASLVSIGDEAFDGDAGLAALHLPEGLRTIGERAFRGLVPLARAEIPGSVRAIGDGAFAGCASIRAVSMPGDAGTVPAVFPDCYANIVSATIVAENGAAGELALPNLMAELFEGCAALTSVELPAELAEIGAEAFEDCTSLAEVGIPSAVTNLGERAFAGCGTLSSIALPKSLEELRDGTFTGCASIAEIVVPESVRRFGNGIFDGCTLLRSVRFVGNAPDYGTADGGPYAGVPAGAKSYVANGSKGWDGIATSMALPEYWPAGTTYEIAFWTPNRFDAAFDPNHGGEAAVEVEQVTGTSYVLPPDPVRLGARFAGWWTAPENGARVTASMQVTATRPLTFYAHWTMNRYWVHFDANGGSGTADPLEMTVGTPAALPLCPFAKVAHDFAGWATEPGGEVVYADGAQVADLAYAQNAAVTLYAVWRSRDWTLADYLDAPALSFGTAGGGEWSPDWDDAKAGGVSLRCDGLPPAAGGGTVEATLRATVVGAGTLAFWWKVSCEEMDEEYGDWFDYAAFSVDGAETAKIAGESGWRKVECAVEGAGEHGLVWAFVRDDYDEDGADWENALWVDGVEWTPAPVTLSFDAGGATEGAPPAAVVKYEGYALALPGPGTLADPPRVFAGWTDGESVYAAGATYVFGSADAVLTAVWTLQTWTLAEAVDAPALVFATGGDADWAVDAASGWTNGVSAKSGSVTNSQASWIETTVSGAGTLSFRWKVLGGIYRNTPFAYAKVETNGAVAAQTHLTDGWEAQALDIVGVGPHTIRWTYLRTSARDCDGDRAWLDGVAWTPAGAPDIVVEGVSIPIAWLDEAAASIVAANGGDFAAAARATAANGRDKVWECYVAGLDPTNATSRLLATIEMENGEPVVTWTPDLNEGGTKSERVYTVEGKENLADPTWGPTNAATRFFRVKVEMP